MANVNDRELAIKKIEIAQAFSPGAPINKYELFAGRQKQVDSVINATFQRGQHVILFGERGVGKTSLVNVLVEVLSSSGLEGVITSSKINCDSSDNFVSLWQRALRQISVELEQNQIGFDPETAKQQVSLELMLLSQASGESDEPESKEKEVRPDDIRFFLQQFDAKIIIILDEFDRISDKTITTLLADTIKALSDHSIDTTLIIVGVADSVEELIAEHHSIERALVQVRMPRMPQLELREVIDSRMEQLNMSIQSEAKDYIVQLSQGLPHYTHLLGLHSAQQSVNKGKAEIDVDDIIDAIRIAVDEAQQNIIRTYHQATSSARETLYEEVLLACALAETDELGYFAPADVRTPMSLIMGKSYDIPQFAKHLKEFCEEKRGPVLERTGSPRRYRFRFRNPLMQPFVILHGLAKGLISQDMLEQISSP